MFFFGLGQTQYASDFRKLSLILCLENMLKFLGPFKKYVRSDGGGERGTPQMCENVQGEGFFQEYT